MARATEGHAFICYVREDAKAANDLERLLREADINVWRDTENLWPGDDWRQKIREAITEGAFAFIPIFTTTSVAKGVSGQNEELYLAAEEMRRRQPGTPWMIPVRFDECRLPRLRLAGGDTLDSIQRVDLFGNDAKRQSERLVTAVRRIISIDSQPPQPPTTSAEQVLVPTISPELTGSGLRVERELKQTLRDPAGDIRLYDLVMPIVEAVHDELADDERFPVDGSVTARQLADQVNLYWLALDGLLVLLVIAGAWSLEMHARTWAEAVERVDRARGGQRSGNTARLAIRWFPLLPMVYAGGIAAVYRQNFSILRALTVDAQLNDDHGRVAAAARARAYQPFELDLVPQILALEASGEIVDDDMIDALSRRQRGHRFTPISDHLHDRLRPKFRGLIPDDDRYSRIFDELEIYLGLIVSDLRIQAEAANEPGGWRGAWIPDPVTGRFTWRDRYAEPGERVEHHLLAQLLRHGDEWPPLKSGLFDGSVARATAAFDKYLPIAESARQNRF